MAMEKKKTHPEIFSRRQQILRHVIIGGRSVTTFRPPPDRRWFGPEGEADLMTAAKMLRHDWQRGKIPFFVPLPRIKDDLSEEQRKDLAEKEEAVADDQRIYCKKSHC